MSRFSTYDEEEYNWSQEAEDQYYQLNKKYFMNSGLFKVSLVDVVHAVVFGLVTGLVSMAGYVLKLGTFFGIDVHSLINVGGLAALGAIVGIIVPLLTTSQGNLVGLVKITK